MAKLHSTKGQALSIDFIFASVLFLLLVVFFFVHFNSVQKPDYLLSELQQEAVSISNILMSEGVPGNWSEDTVILPGITDGSYRLDEDKWSILAGINVTEQRTLLGVKHNFLILLQNESGCLITVNSIAYIGEGAISSGSCGKVDLDSTHIIPIHRILIHNEKTTKLSLYVWS